MNISAVSNNTVTGNSNNDSEVKFLQQYKNDLTNQLKQVRESKEDGKTKAEKIKELTQQIADVDMQIQQAIMEAKKQKLQDAMEKAAENNTETQTETNGVVMSESLNKVISLQSNMKDYNKLSEVRTKIIGEMGVADAQIKSALSGGSTKYQQGQLATDSSKLAQVENSMGKKAAEIHDGVEKSIKLGIKEAEKNRESKDDQTEETTINENSPSARPDTSIKSITPSEEDLKSKPVENSNKTLQPAEEQNDTKQDKDTKTQTINIKV